VKSGPYAKAKDHRLTSIRDLTLRPEAATLRATSAQPRVDDEGARLTCYGNRGRNACVAWNAAVDPCRTRCPTSFAGD
jgi:hypothetical protein